MKIGIGNDHAAVDMKFEVADYLKSLGYEVVNYGTDKKESCNYPEYGEAVARTGVGISLAANKVKGIRAAVCSEPATARLSRQHNNTNILAFGARIVGMELAKDIVKAWLDAEFEGGRHQTRVDMIMEIENK